MSSNESIEAAQEAWFKFVDRGSWTYALLPHPQITDLYLTIWTWEKPPIPGQPYTVTSFHLTEGRAVLVGSSAYTLDLRGALAEVIDRIKGLTI